jgi:hypothetical protein
MKKLIALAQRRANNTGHTQYVVTRQYYQSEEKGHTQTRVMQHPDFDRGRWLTLARVTPDRDERAKLLKRRKTRGGNRVRVGNNVR